MEEYKCVNEAIDENGRKVMQFTKGKTYEFRHTGEDNWITEDDNGKEEEFWDLRFMFERV